MLFLALLGACVPSSVPPTAPASPWTVVLADGSNNVTRVVQTASGATWTYEPMTPERSSSGTYSGGEPANGVLDDDATAGFWEAVGAALKDESGHARARAMGTFSLSVTMDGATESVVLKPAAGARLQEQLPER
jgi:hypothetical protein